jgi:hypothetical protein
MPQIPKKRGPLPLYQSKDEKYQARKARQRERYQQKRAIQQHSTFQNVFQAVPRPAPSIQHPIHLNDFAPASPHDFESPVGYNNGFIPLQIDDEFEELLPPPSPSLDLASIVISEIESCQLNVYKPI